MVMTVLEAEVPAERSGDLKRAFEESGRELPPPIRESFLLHEEHSNVWRITTVWSSREDLEVYRRSVDTPAGVVMFREAGAEPTLTINDVVGHVEQDRPGGNGSRLS